MARFELCSMFEPAACCCFPFLFQLKERQCSANLSRFHQTYPLFPVLRPRKIKRSAGPCVMVLRAAESKTASEKLQGFKQRGI
jgi:hypothetical protein